MRCIGIMQHIFPFIHTSRKFIRTKINKIQTSQTNKPKVPFFQQTLPDGYFDLGP